jgi:hypothetical protein
MKLRISDSARYILVAILPVIAILGAYKLSNISLLGRTLSLIGVSAVATTCLVNIILPVAINRRRAFGLTLLSIWLCLVIFSVGPLFRVQIYEPEDYVVYFLLCGVIPFISLLFWCGLAFSAWVSARLGTLIRDRKTPFGVRKSRFFLFALVLTGIACVFWSVSLAAAHAQTESLLSNGWNIVYIPEVGFWPGEIRIIRLDQQGNPWVASTTGIYRKVGSAWESYLESTFFIPFGMEIDRSGRLLVSDGTRMHMIDQGKPKVYDRFASTRIINQQGALWYWCAEHMYCSEMGEQKIDLSGRDLLAFDPSGRAWAYERFPAVISVYDGGQWKDIPIAKHFIPDLDMPYAFDSQGRLWLGGYGSDDMCCRLTHLDGAQWIWEDVPFVAEGNQWAWITGLTFDAQDHLWVSAVGTNTGLAVKNEGSWVFYKASRFTNFGQTNDVRALFLDQQNRLWFGAGSSLVSINMQEDKVPLVEPAIDNLVDIRRWSWNSMLLFAVGAMACGMFALYKSLSIPLRTNRKSDSQEDNTFLPPTSG